MTRKKQLIFKQKPGYQVKSSKKYVQTNNASGSNSRSMGDSESAPEFLKGDEHDDLTIEVPLPEKANSVLHALAVMHGVTLEKYVRQVLIENINQQFVKYKQLSEVLKNYPLKSPE